MIDDKTSLALAEALLLVIDVLSVGKKALDSGAPVYVGRFREAVTTLTTMVERTLMPDIEKHKR